MSLKWEDKNYCFTRDELISFFRKYFRCEIKSQRNDEIIEFVDNYISNLKE